MCKREWQTIKQYSDILFEFYNGIAKITINRPEVYNAFRPQTNAQMLDAMAYCRATPEVRVVVYRRQSILFGRRPELQKPWRIPRRRRHTAPQRA